MWWKFRTHRASAKGTERPMRTKASTADTTRSSARSGKPTSRNISRGSGARQRRALRDPRLQKMHTFHLDILVVKMSLCRVGAVIFSSSRSRSRILYNIWKNPSTGRFATGAFKLERNECLVSTVEKLPFRSVFLADIILGSHFTRFQPDTSAFFSKLRAVAYHIGLFVLWVASTFQASCRTVDNGLNLEHALSSCLSIRCSCSSNVP